MLENKFQANLIKELKERFPGCIVMKNDPTYIQGIPDLLVLHKDKWASLECKKSAGATYSEEVKSLNAKLDLALANAPRERQAQTMANATVAAKRKDNPDMTKAEVKKASQQALAQARSSVGAKRSNIEITDKEWEAIQAGAISENKLTQILNNTNADTIRQRATSLLIRLSTEVQIYSLRLRTV